MNSVQIMVAVLAVVFLLILDAYCIYRILRLNIDKTQGNTEEMLQQIRNEIDMICLDASDLQELFSKSVEVIHKVSGISGCSICTFDDEKNMLEFRAGTVISKENLEHLYSNRIISRLTEIAYEGEPIYFEDIDKSNEYLMPFASIGIRNIGIIPVKRHGIVIGTLNVASTALRQFPEETKRALQSIAYSIGAAFLRLTSEECMVEAEGRWKFALEEYGDIIIDVDYTTNKAYCSEYLKEVLGWPVEDELDVMKTWESMVHVEDISVLTEAINEHIRGTLEKVLVELRVKTREGKYKWFLFRAKLIKKDVNNNPLRLIAILTEVTHLKNYEQELLRSKQEVEASNKVKDLFLANISHELRTPMNGILGMTQLMELSGVTAEQQDNINILKESGNRMMALINNLISYTTMETEEVMLNENSLNLQDMVCEILSEHEKNAVAKRIVLQANIDERLPSSVLGDYEKLSVIIGQLVDNAIKFTSGGSVKVSAKLASEGDSGNKIWVHISVQDTGTGIEKDHIGKLFGYFTQLDDTYTRKYQGAGLGLAICKRLVEILGGEIEVESALGIGSTFTVKVALKKEEPSRSEPIRKRSDTGNVLIADDDEVSRHLLGILCEKNNFKVKYAVNGREAVNQCLDNEFDLIFMDIQMPELSGIEATKLIRSLEYEGRDMPIIIAVTAYALKNDRSRFLSEGFDDYLSKPIDTVELIAVAKRWMLLRNENREIV